MSDTESMAYQSPSYQEYHRPQAVPWRDLRPPEYEAYRRRWDELARTMETPEFPIHLDIETTNACNLKCPMCPRTQLIAKGSKRWSPGGRIGLMSRDLYGSLIDQAAAEGCVSVKLNFLGEPLLHPDVVWQTRYARQKGLYVMMNTNAVRLSEDMSRELLEAGLTDMFFSFDSPYPSVYEGIRVGASFSGVVANIQRFMSLRAELGRLDVQTRVSMISYWDEKGTDDSERGAYTDLFDDLGVDEIGFAVYSDPSLDYSELQPEPVPGFTCGDLFRRTFVLWDGAVQVCCGEWERQYIVGDANRTPIKTIWQTDKYKRLRRAHRNGRYHDIAICRRCSLPYLYARDMAGSAIERD